MCEIYICMGIAMECVIVNIIYNQKFNRVFFFWFTEKLIYCCEPQWTLTTVLDNDIICQLQLFCMFI